MRTLSTIFVFLFAVSVSAQSTAVRQSFTDGTRLATAGEFEKALTSYRTALIVSKTEGIDPKFLARLHYNLGVCEYRLNRPDLAIKELETALSLSGRSNHVEAYYALGMAETTLKNWPRARLAFLAALKAERANGEAWFDLAFVYLSEKDFVQAEAAFRKAIVYKSIDTPLSHNNVGVILAMHGDLRAATKEFEAAFRTSGGRLKIAENNLKFCESKELTGLIAESRSGITTKNNQ